MHTIRRARYVRVRISFVPFSVGVVLMHRLLRAVGVSSETVADSFGRDGERLLKPVMNVPFQSTTTQATVDGRHGE